MKYAFIDSMGSLTYNNGIKIQAIMWKEGLEKLGHKVTLVNLWENIDFASFDAVIIFAMGSNIYGIVYGLAKINPNIILAPIIDPNRSDKFYRFLFRFYGFKKIALSNHIHDTWIIRNNIKLWLVRSEEEKHYVNYCLNIPIDKISKIPLNFRVPIAGSITNKEDFCLHVSRLTAPNKNVPRLIEAAKKYNFKLKLAGHISGEKEAAYISKLIGGNENIQYVGEINDSCLLDLYSKAKVFALPSLREGVGMVALEAAAYGCEIVLTNIGAPKEYYNGKAILVDPKNIDDIGKSIKKALTLGFSQPELKTYVEEHFNQETCCSLLNEQVSNAIQR